jgi:transposase
MADDPRSVPPRRILLTIVRRISNKAIRHHNRSYTDMARHYGTAVLPTRPGRPRDKAKVEACVGIVERWLLGGLRNKTFYSLAELNAAVAECMALLNEVRVVLQFGKTRRKMFEEIDGSVPKVGGHAAARCAIAAFSSELK